MQTQTLNTGGRLLTDLAIAFTAAGFAVVSTPAWIIIAFILIGHAHFLMTYLYQYRAGRMNRTYLSVLGLTIVAIGAHLFYVGNHLQIFFFTSLLFSTHFALDEFHLRGEELTPYRIVTVAAYVVLSLSFLFKLAFRNIPVFTEFPAYAGAAMLGVILLRLATGMRSIAKTEIYLWVMSALVFILCSYFNLIESMLGIVVVIHSLNWYLRFGRKYHRLPAERRYWMEVTATFAVFAILYIGYTSLSIYTLRFLFEPVYYYCWAIGHLVLTSRLIRRTP